MFSKLLRFFLFAIIVALCGLAFWRFGLPVLQPKTGQLSVSTPFQKGTVYFDGQKLGESPLYLKNLSVGDHTLKITSENSEWETKTTLTSSTFNTLELNLSSSEQFISGENLFFKTGEKSLLILSKPEKSKVFLDKKEVGVTPLKLQPSAGVVLVTLKKDGYLSREITPNITDKFRLTAHVFLSADPFGVTKKLDASSKVNLFSLYNPYINLAKSYSKWVEGIKFTQRQFTGSETRFDVIIDPNGKSYILNQTEWENKKASKALANVGYLLTKESDSISKPAAAEWEKIKAEFN